MVTDLVSELTSIGYELLLEGDHVKLHYMKPDDPPDSARMLIDELKVCKAEVVNILRAKSGPGSNATFKWLNPYPRGTPEARRESLLQVMTAIWETAREEVKKKQPQGPVLTKSVLEAEDEVAVVYQRVLSGEALLADFRQAAEKWMLAVLNAPNFFVKDDMLCSCSRTATMH